MPEHYIRNLEQAKSLLDYFLDHDFSEQTLLAQNSQTALLNGNIFAVASSSPNPDAPPPANPPPQTKPEFITLPTACSGNIVLHAPSEVLLVKAAKDYTTFFLTSGKEHLVSGRLGVWAKRLAGCGFLRVHRSHCVNIRKIEQWQHEKDYLVAKLCGGQEITVAASYKSEFLRSVRGI
ncbi:MAG: LytTR family transcriptional regulator [Candidatus Kapabacteria bacterium]|jgi:DNA-binding LytR/AlgR family response regulator|nr:LytTR family transcriptional regulator [Candidatus Kapabacteria bacterium]